MNKSCQNLSLRLGRKILNSKNNMMINRIVLIVISFLPIFCVGCSSMLPTGEEVVKSPWNSFDEAQAAFDQIIVDETSVHELSQLGFDPHKTPNIQIINYLDILRRFNYEPGHDSHYPPGVISCIKANESCYGYYVNIEDIHKERVGNFWLDLFVIKREEHKTGWSFQALILILDDEAIYKLAGGSPSLDATKKKKNPLGPLQDIGPDLIDVK